MANLLPFRLRIFIYITRRTVRNYTQKHAGSHTNPHLSFRFALPSCWNGKSVAYLLKVLREGEEGFFFSPEQPWIIYYTVENSPGVWSHIVPGSFSNLNAQFLREKENKKAHNSHVPFKHARKHIQMHGHHSYWPQILFNLSDLFGAEST